MNTSTPFYHPNTDLYYRQGESGHYEFKVTRPLFGNPYWRQSDYDSGFRLRPAKVENLIERESIFESWHYQHSLAQV